MDTNVARLLCSALVRLFDGSLVGYHMDEESGWSLNVGQLEQEISTARAQGKR